MVYPDGNPQPHEVVDHDEALCLCGNWFPLEQALTWENYYGTYVYYLCPTCQHFQYLRKRERWRKRHSLKARLRRRLKQLDGGDLAAPKTAARFLKKFNHLAGGAEGLAEHLVDILKEGDDSRAAINIIKLYIGLVRHSQADAEAEYKMQQLRKRKEGRKKTKIFDLPF